MNSPVFYTTEFLTKYVAGWIGFCVLAAVLLAFRWRALRSEAAPYLQFLSVRWKLLSFLPGFAFVTFAGRLTDDPTWDVISGGGMALLTFLTAPWAGGIFYRVLRFQRPVADFFIAVAFWLFSSSWFYDGYLFLRDGRYTDYWLGNLLISPFIYLAAGFLWNLEARAEGGFRLSFLRDDWPAPPEDRRFQPVFAVSVPLVIVAVYLLVAYVDWPALKPLASLLGLKQ
jgi:hypothetical protein